MSRFCKSHFTILLILTVLLSGCAGKSPTENIIDHHIGLVNEAVKDPALSAEAKEKLKTCQAGLLSAKESFKTEIAKYKSDIRYWKSMVYGLALLILLYVGFKVTKR